MAGKTPSEVAGTISQAILDFLSAIPTTAETASPSPGERARAIANDAARRAAVTSGAFALPPGPAGLLTILPDLLAVWRIQAQMVADIAGAFGRVPALSRAQMLYCLFKHSAAQAVRDLLVRVGERGLIERAAAKVGAKVAQRALAKSVSRWLPVVGVLGVAGYAYYDTAQVARTAIALFERPAVKKVKLASSRRPAARPASGRTRKKRKSSGRSRRPRKDRR